MLKFITKHAIIRLAVLAAIIAIVCIWAYFTMIVMPGKSYAGPLPLLSDTQLSIRANLVYNVEKLADEIGERNIWQYKNLTESAKFIEKSLAEAGYVVNRHNYSVQGKTCCNIEAEVLGTKHPEQIVIIGAHYDSAFGSPGANDNASAVAAALVLAQGLAGKRFRCKCN